MDRQTPVKTLPSRQLRLRAVINYKIVQFISVCMSDSGPKACVQQISFTETSRAYHDTINILYKRNDVIPSVAN